jgi:serine/threonine protein kinase
VQGLRLGNERYELVEEIGHGGMGEVWIGNDLTLERKVAVKILHSSRGEIGRDHVRRFWRESRITARLEHPGVPAVYDTGEVEDGRPYLVMQLIHGVVVSRLIRSGPLPIEWAASVAAQTCAVLAAAHARSLVHRDLKPSNIMLQPDGCAKVLDFGLAVAPNLADYSRITLSAVPIGTPAYMAPEQVAANLSEPATDLYQLGCTLHEMLTGRHVFMAKTTYSMMDQQMKEPPPPVRSLRPEVPPELESLILDLLRKRPEDRPGGADEVYQRLLPFAKDLSSWPGVLEKVDSPTPMQMYAALVGNASWVAAPSRPQRVVEPIGKPARLESAMTRHDLAKARGEARQLMRELRFTQAADVLSGAERVARSAFGKVDDDVIRIRYDRANAIYECGDYRRALTVFQALVEDLAASTGSAPDLLFDCRAKEAMCRAMTGQAAEALERLTVLLPEGTAIYAPADPRLLDLRKQLALLQLRSGLRDLARETLTGLLADLRAAGPSSRAEVADITGLLATIGSGSS